MNFLISGCNGDIGISVINIILKKFPESKIFASDCVKPKIIFKNVNYLHFPHCENVKYLSFLKYSIKKYEIDLFIPTISKEINFLVINKLDDISKKILINNKKIIDTFSNKQKTSDWFKKNKFPWLKTTKLENCSPRDLPVVVKPNFGTGSKDIYYCKDSLYLNALKVGLKGDFICQEMLDQNSLEYTIAIVKIKDQANYCVMERELFGGISFQVKAIKKKILDEFSSKIISSMPNFCFLNLQVKIRSNKVYCFEINPRLSSTILMRSLLGFEDLNGLIKYKLKNEISLKFNINYKKLINRRFDSFVFS